MRLQRLLLILTAFYFVFIGGSAYFTLIPAVRFFHHAFVTLLLGGWLVLRVRKGLPQTPLNLPLFAVFGVWFASAIVSLDPRMAVENLWFPVTHVMIFFMLADLFQRGREKLVVETQLILAALVIFITAIELGSWYFGWGIIPNTEIGWAQVRIIPLEALRVSLAMNISTLLAGYAAPLVMLTAAAALTVRQKSLRTVLWGMAALLLGILILTFSRGGWLSFAVAFSFFVIVRLTQWKAFSQRIPVRALIGVALVGFIGVLVAFIVFTVSQDRRSGDEGRVDMWLGAVLITRDYPILGVGPGLYGRAFREYRDVSIARDKLASAHNAYLNTAAETGIIGVIVSLWLLVIIMRSWWQRWKAAEARQEKIRLEAALAALIGLGVHSLVDAFTVTPIVLLMLGIVAYIVTPRRRGDEIAPQPLIRRLPVFALLLIVIGYGVWFLIQVDPAYGRYLNSFRGDFETRLAEAKAAEGLDPSLKLYALQTAYLQGFQTETSEQLDRAVEGYQAALLLEPTWDTGWMNLGALYLRQGNAQSALNAFTEAQRINPLTFSALNRARVAEADDLLPRTPIVTAYSQAVANEMFNGRLPLAAYWTETPMRTAALEQYLQTEPLEVQYRVYAIHNPERAAALVPQQPMTAEAWWIVGEHALNAEGDIAKAEAAFTQAIAIDIRNGDYYVARARARLDINPAGAGNDLDYAYLLGTTYENLYAVKAQLAAAPEEAEELLRRGQPIILTGQEFAAVLFGGRASIFEVMPELHPPTINTP